MNEPTKAVLDLLAAIRDMTDVPMPIIDTAAQRDHNVLMSRRLSELHITLSVALDPQWAGTLDPAREAAHLRRRLEKMPATYPVWQDPEQARGEQA